ncbi:hypothetical protein CHS0354_006864 [Potamilus streckersoni]|uniref:Phospho-2-dehydro-3-deoxyheptonate aldolase n=1 Tax=Potamilus streckersoni TaxID=2493646 RepID=A0AAE0TF87_9BIVA|nr:hypothetical protein CHS0354_006864 [Potamilus streckersoni]
MAVVLTYAGSKPVVKIGRIAGQFAKPRSNPTEIVNGTELPSYRGDMVNRDAPTLADRQANPLNMLEGGFASLKNIHRWNKDFVLNSSAGQKYEVIADHIDEALHFMEAIGFDLDEVQQLKEVNFYTSHEALLLDYEEPLTRKDSLTQKWYGCSAHMLWIGDRTRQPDGAHIEYMRGIHNPIGLKIGPNYSPDEIKRILDTLNPANDKGKILLITRFGADKIEIHLPKLIRMIKQCGANVVWICDPMHGNTYSASNKLKTRSFDHIFREISDFFRIHYTESTLPGGIHIELTGLDVTECIGGIQGIDENLLTRNYASNCDPRLNASQSIELAFRLAE